MQILHSPTKNSPFLVVFKPAHLPSAPLFEGDESVLTECQRLFPEILTVHGKKEVEHGLIHRIDNETSGLVLIATSQESYDNLILSQQKGKFEKWYRAEIDKIPDCAEKLGGFPELPDFHEGKNLTLESFFRPFGEKGRAVRPVTAQAGRAALKKCGRTAYKTEISFEGDNIALCHITAGFRHQVRCHLAWCGFPVKGDKLYNPLCHFDCDGSKMRFTACRIAFPHPLSGEVLSFELDHS